MHQDWLMEHSSLLMMTDDICASRRKRKKKIVNRTVQVMERIPERTDAVSRTPIAAPRLLFMNEMLARGTLVILRLVAGFWSKLMCTGLSRTTIS